MPPRQRHSPHPRHRARRVLALLTVVALSGCASLQEAVDTVKARLPATAAPATEPDTTADTAPAAARPMAKATRKPSPAAPAAPPPAATPTPPTPAPAPRAAPPPIDGPAWLAQCAEVQVAGGVARCDADRLLARPSATVQVFTRDPALAVRTGGGDITLRPGLPQRYRFFVLP
ncbi:MAG: hypothetical protein R3E34_14760 [Rhodocyclaceae bacterium]